MLRARQFFNILTFKCAFRHSGVQFFSIWTSKSGPGSSFFLHFHFRICFSAQRRAILRHLNFKKCFGADVFCTFSLQNVLFATAACNFWCLLSAPSSAPAALTSLLLDWPDTRIIEKTQHFATSLTFRAYVSSFFQLSDYCIFCRLTWLLYYCFSTLHIVGSFYLNFLRWTTYLLWDDPPSTAPLALRTQTCSTAWLCPSWVQPDVWMLESWGHSTDRIPGSMISMYRYTLEI